MFRKERICEIGGYDMSLACYEDWDLYVRLALAARLPITNIDERLSFKRIHPEQFFGGYNGFQFSPEGRGAATTVMRRVFSLRETR